nr:hepatitis A virus cellular receptor 1 homolog isoform X1 [Monopterus albus]
MKLVLLLALLTVGACGDLMVVGQAGQNITLRCTYDIKYHGERAVCWNRGDIPNHGCDNKLVATGHYMERGRNISSRFQLQGRLKDGDVSLTILNLTEADAGRYGCRVDIYGWFNDEKHHFDLTIKGAPWATTSATSHRETSTLQTTARLNPGQMTSTHSAITSCSSSVSSVEAEGSSAVTVVLVCVFCSLTALAAIGGLILIGRRWRFNKIPQQQVHTSALFNSPSSTLHLQSRGSAVENIYQIDGGANGGEYDYCP